MVRVAGLFNGFFKALLFVAVFLLASAIPAKSSPSPAAPNAEPPAVLMSLQDQCLSRAERSDNPDRMRAICIGWALLAIEKGGLAAAKANALKDACLREVRYGGDGQIREFRAQGEALCRNFHASVSP
jgi:hypothetical protein